MVMAILVLFVLINSTLFQNHLSVNYRSYDFGGLIFFYLAVRLIDSKGLILSFVFLVIGGLIQVTYGELQLYNFYPALNPNFPITGSFFNPGPYSGYLTAVFPIALGLHFFIDQWKRDDITPFRDLIKIIAIVTALGVILVLSVTASRAAWIALVFSGGFLMFFRFRWDRRFLEALDTPIKRTIGILLGLAIVAGVGTGLYYLKKDSADGRTLIWKASWEMIRENPLTGLGFDRFQAGYMESQAAWFRGNPNDPSVPLADDVVYAFNEGVQLMVEQGLFGIGLVLILLFAAFKIRGSLENPEILMAQAGLVSILVFGMFSYPSHILSIKICGIFYLAILAGRSQILVDWKVHQYGKTVKGIFVLLAFFVAMIAFVTSNSLYKAVKEWNYAYSLYHGGAFAPAVDGYEKALPMFDHNGEFLTNYGKALSMAGKHKEAIFILESAKKYLGNTVIQTTLGDSYMALGKNEQAETAYQLAAEMLPDRFYPRYLLVKLYASTGAWDKMEPLAHRLIEKEPKIPSRAVEEIKTEIQDLLERIPGRWTKFEPDNL